jgi:hypothetical protein
MFAWERAISTAWCFIEKKFHPIEAAIMAVHTVIMVKI